MMEYGRKPTDYESAPCMGLSIDQIEGIRKSACIVSLMSLDSPVRGIDGCEDTMVGDMVASGQNLEEETVDHLDQEQLCSVLWECVDSLEGRQPEVIRMRYQEGLTLAAVGQECGTTREVVRQTESKALRELRKPRNSDRLRPYLPEAEQVYSAALVGNGVRRFNQTWTSSTERVALKAVDWEKRRLEELERLEKYWINVAVKETRS